jgi:hypothetical protein
MDSPQSELPCVGETQIHGEGIIVDFLFACMVIMGAYYIAWGFRVSIASRASIGFGLRVATFTTAAMTIAVIQGDVGKYLNLCSQMSHTVVWSATFGFWLMISRGIARVFTNRARFERSHEELGAMPPSTEMLDREIGSE